MRVNPEDSGEEPGSKLIEGNGMLKGPGGVLTPYQIIQKRIYQRYIRGKMIFDGGILPPLTPVCFEITNDITQKESKVRAYNNVIENEYIRVEVGGPGIIRSIINKSTNREYLKKISSPVCIELWPETGGNCWTLGKLDKREKAEYKGSITVIENGPVRATIRIEHSWNNSIFITEVSLYSGQRWVELRMEIQWYEKEVLARLCIKPELNGKHQKIYGIPFGYEKATGDEKEVPAVTWAALGDDDIGIAVIDKDRPGHTFVEDGLRVSLVRCSTQPSFEPRSDSGVINTSFRLVPFDGKLQDAEIPLLADEFCHPSIAWQRISEVQLQQESTKESQDIIKSNQSGNQVKEEEQMNNNYPTLLHMEGQGISTSCFKAAENKDGYILRLYESKGRKSSAIIKLSKKLSNYIVYEGNLLEEENIELKVDNNCINIGFKPFEIKTIIFRSNGTIPEITVDEFCT
jgi:alpha-mannosidase